MVGDKNYRIFSLNLILMCSIQKFFINGRDPYDFFDKMDINDDSSHAFYLGIELAKAQIALQLGKDYDQDNELKWGVALEEKNTNLLKRPDLKGLRRNEMIFETIVSTLDKNKEINFAPFGIKKSKNTILISPFVPSKTLNNLKENKFAVVNYTDRSEFFVDCIIGKLSLKEKCKNFPGFLSMML